MLQYINGMYNMEQLVYLLPSTNYIQVQNSHLGNFDKLDYRSTGNVANTTTNRDQPPNDTQKYKKKSIIIPKNTALYAPSLF